MRSWWSAWVGSWIVSTGLPSGRLPLHILTYGDDTKKQLKRDHHLVCLLVLIARRSSLRPPLGWFRDAGALEALQAIARRHRAGRGNPPPPPSLTNVTMSTKSPEPLRLDRWSVSLLPGAGNLCANACLHMHRQRKPLPNKKHTFGVEMRWPPRPPAPAASYYAQMEGAIRRGNTLPAREAGASYHAYAKRRSCRYWHVHIIHVPTQAASGLALRNATMHIFGPTASPSGRPYCVYWHCTEYHATIAPASGTGPLTQTGICESGVRWRSRRRNPACFWEELLPCPRTLQRCPPDRLLKVSMGIPGHPPLPSHFLPRPVRDHVQ